MTPKQRAPPRPALAFRGTSEGDVLHIKDKWHHNSVREFEIGGMENLVGRGSVFGFRR